MGAFQTRLFGHARHAAVLLCEVEFEVAFLEGVARLHVEGATNFDVYVDLNRRRVVHIGPGITFSGPDGQFCSGNFDWRTDGAVTEVGWVADLVKQGILPGKLLCPSNPAQLSETYDDLLNLSAPSEFDLRYDSTPPAVTNLDADGGDESVRLRWAVAVLYLLAGGIDDEAAA